MDRLCGRRRGRVDRRSGRARPRRGLDRARHVEAKGKNWATDATGEQKIVVGQAFEDTEKLVVDFTDEGISSIVASLRLFKASEGEDYVTGGTLRVTGVGAWAVTCSGP